MALNGQALEDIDEQFVAERVQEARLILERTDTDAIDRALDADLSFRALAVVHAATTTVFGFCLILTAVLGNVTAGQSYRYLVALPNWPWSVGIVMVSVGLLKLAAIIRFRQPHAWYPWAWWLGSICWALYGSAFLVGAIQTRSTLGPQVLYLSLAVHASIVAAMTRRRGREG